MKSQVDNLRTMSAPLLLLLVTSLLASSNVHVLARNVDYCFADEDEPYLYMATKTAYHFVHGDKTQFQTVPSKKSPLVDRMNKLIE